MYKIAPILLILILMVQKLPVKASEKYDPVVEKKIALDLNANGDPLNDSISGIVFVNIQYHQPMKIVQLKGNLFFNNFLVVGGLNKNGKIQNGVDNVNLNGQLISSHGVTKNGRIF